MEKQYRVKLTREERNQLCALITSGRGSARKITHARILLKADEGPHGPGWIDRQIREALDVSMGTVARVRERCVLEGLEAALGRRKPDREYDRLLDGEAEAHLIALACSKAPAGRSKWTLRLLADEMVALAYVEHVSHETVRRVLKKTNLSLG